MIPQTGAISLADVQTEFGGGIKVGYGLELDIDGRILPTNVAVHNIDKNIYGSPIDLAIGSVVAVNQVGRLIKAKADSIQTSNVFGIVIDSNPAYSANGAWVISTGPNIRVNQDANLFNNGTIYYLSDVIAGAFTSTPPTAVGSVLRPILVGTDLQTTYRNNAVWLNSVGVEIAGPDYAQVSITNADLASGICTITHNLEQQFVDVAVYDNTFNNRALPSSIVTYTNANTLSVNVGTIAGGAITGTWVIKVSR